MSVLYLSPSPYFPLYLSLVVSIVCLFYEQSGERRECASIAIKPINVGPGQMPVGSPVRRLGAPCVASAIELKLMSAKYCNNSKLTENKRMKEKEI